MLVELKARDLLLASWELPVGLAASGLPPGLEPALLPSGAALVSVAIARHQGVRAGPLRVPGFSQATVRTYVNGPVGLGICFLSIRVGLAGLGAALWGLPVRPARIHVENGVAEAPGVGFSFRYRRQETTAKVPTFEGIPVGDQTTAYVVSAGLRYMEVEHPSFQWDQVELVATPRFDPVLALGFDVKEPDSVLYASSTGFRFRLPAEKVQ
jgi:uncharacterized protein YqjF (DUF2071 family)